MKIEGKSVQRSIKEIASQPEQVRRMAAEFSVLIEKSMKYLPECGMALALEAHGGGEEKMHALSKTMMDNLSHKFGAMYQDFEASQSAMKFNGPENESLHVEKQLIEVMNSLCDIVGITAILCLQAYLARMEVLMDSDEEVQQ